MDDLSTVAQAFAGLMVGGFFVYQLVITRRNGRNGSNLLTEIRGLRKDLMTWMEHHNEDDRVRDQVLREIKEDTTRILDRGR